MKESPRLDRPVDPSTDHLLGPVDAPITLVEYGSYACSDCRTANEGLTVVRDDLGERLRYVFRHRPLPGSELARRAAELAERASNPEAFWAAHVALMSRSPTLTEDDLRAVSRDLALARRAPDEAESPDAPGDEAAAAEIARAAKARVDADDASARASGVRVTPTFFINGRHYDGLWEKSAFADALLGSLGHRVRAAALDFARWAPSAGLLLLVATVLALLLTNSAAGDRFLEIWQIPFGLVLGDADFRMPLVSWINDALLTVFFLVVGLEIKRELTVGHLATRRSAALPLAAALGGMAGPILIYLAILPAGPWAHGWGVPMATDTAFAVALIVMMGSRIPIELRVFLTAATILDDIGAIVVVALFYSEELHGGALALAGGILVALLTLSRLHIYKVAPYAVLGVGLWAAIHAGGLHATLAGVLLAVAIPTRPPPNLRALMAQADAILAEEARQSSEALRSGPSPSAMDELDAIHDRLESPADRLLRVVSLRSSYFVLPLFAFANAGVAISTEVVAGHGPLMAAIVAALVLGKPLGMIAATALAVRVGLASKPAAYGWRHVAGAGALSGIGFTMSLFIAGEAFPAAADFAAAKIAVFTASVLAAGTGVAILWNAGARSE
jgi:NhaA family Na+:H+ antiporter